MNTLIFDKYIKMEYCNNMESKMKFFIIPLIILAVSCLSTPPETAQSNTPASVVEAQVEPEPVKQVETEPPAGPVRQPDPVQPPAEVFNPSQVTQQQYTSTMEDVQRFIENLNRIISNKNYGSWRAALSTEYFNEISSPANLKQLSEQPAMTTRKIVLRTPEDYFLHVVVPSRANSRVDDIEFIGQNRVKAFTVNKSRTGEETRLVLYDLERSGNSWIIIN
jgi:hypothetical protein